MRNKGIISLEASNILKIKAIKITPEGSLVTIGGENGAGKSSVLDSIMFALGGDRSLPDKPIRDGQDKGKIVIKIDGYTITKTITAKGSYLKITNANGAEIKSAQSFLNNLVGKVSFDPLAFTHMSPKEQGGELRKLVGIDTAELDAKRSVSFDDRRVANAQAKSLVAQLNACPKHDGIGHDEQSASGLISQIDESRKDENRIDITHDAIQSRERMISAHNQKIGELEMLVVKLEEELEEHKDEIIDLPEPADRNLLSQQLEQIEETNQKIRENACHDRIAKDLERAESTANDHDNAIKKVDATKDEMLRTAKYPIDGLCFDEDGTVTYNNLPFSQASSAEQIRVSVAIGLAMNPKLPVMRIYDGSLLGPKALAMIGEMADEANAQIWIERVGEGDEVSVVIEDGMVKESQPTHSEGIEE